MIFIVGNGRSGTNLLGRIIGDVAGVHCDLEVQPQFQYSVKVSVHRDTESYNRLVGEYRQRLREHPIYATKDHTNLWCMGHLLNDFPAAKFVAITRPIHQVVYSSLNHQGVMQWIKGTHPENPLSGNYLDAKTPVEKLVLRWLLHDAMIQSWYQHPNFHLVQFDELMYRPAPVIEALGVFLELNIKVPTYLDPSVTKKWHQHKGDLVKEIEQAIIKYNPLVNA